MALIRDYFKKTRYYKQLYGERTVLFMQVGAFYEVYALLNPDGTYSGSEIANVSRICDLAIANKSGNDIEGKPVKMSGFQTYLIDKFSKKLLDAGYTIPVINQDQQAANSTRSLFCVLSPGTSFSTDNEVITNNTSCIWLSKLTQFGKDKIVIGAANVDVITGTTSIFEYQTEYLNSPSTFDSLEKFISVYNPNEIIIISNLDSDYIDNAISYTDITSKSIHRIDIDEASEEIKKIIHNCELQIYQTEILEKFYISSKKDHALEAFWHFPIACQSFCYLLDFIEKHNPNLIKNIDVPRFENFSNRLTLANHTLQQLNIIGDGTVKGKNSSVLSLLNNCITNMGKRRFAYNLMNPTDNISLLEQEYNITEHIVQKFDDVGFIKPILRDIKDLEKLERSTYMKRVTPVQIAHFYNDLVNIQSLFTEIDSDETFRSYILSNSKIDYDKFLSYCEKIKTKITQTINIDIAKGVDGMNFEKHENFIERGISSMLDNKQDEYDEINDQIKALQKYFDSILIKTEKKSKTTEYVKIHKTTTEISLGATAKRCNVLKANLPAETVTIKYVSSNDLTEKTMEVDFKNITFPKQSGSNQQICTPFIRTICENYFKFRNQISDFISNIYIEFIISLQQFSLEFANIIEYISVIDLIYNKAYIAKKYNYCKPSIKQCDKSYFDAKGIRHCLIEQLQTKERYVSNDISLGKEKDGVLLYGTNAVGKTSIIRAIGISVIMAQAGLFVPCKSFEYSPYKNIFSRILGNDNLFKGLSTFAVEMSELRHILRYTDENSLILGDELCSGTEIESAISIFVTGIQLFHKKQSSFIFATHLHQIVDYDEITSLNKLALKHMTVRYDRETGKLIYDRKLNDGSGDSVYGLEVCKSLDLPDEFLDNAYKIRNKYDVKKISVLESKTSHFNTRKIIGLCELCNKKPAAEVHHLAYQSNANENGYIDYEMHKNNVANLCNICTECHDMIHRQEKELYRKKTSDGYELFAK